MTTVTFEGPYHNRAQDSWDHNRYITVHVDGEYVGMIKGSVGRHTSADSWSISSRSVVVVIRKAYGPDWTYSNLRNLKSMIVKAFAKEQA